MLTREELSNFYIIAGPCAVEGAAMTLQIAERLKRMSIDLGIPIIFKASYRKANRTKLDSFTGIGDAKAIEILSNVREEFGMKILTDVHETIELDKINGVVDIIQIPAFLCRQTRLIVAAAKTGAWINIKKGQFMSPESMQFAYKKVLDSGNQNIMLTERGTQFGYGDLVVDFRSIPTMKTYCDQVIFDCTHSVQQPNQTAGVTGGKPQMIQTLASAAIASGATGLFIETHPDPANAKSDGANMMPLDRMEDFLKTMQALFLFVNEKTNV